MGLHSDDVYLPDTGWYERMTAVEKAHYHESQTRVAVEKANNRSALEAAHIEAISAVDFETNAISAQIDFSGDLSTWSIGGVYLSGNMNPGFYDWDGYDLVLQHCKTWARANPKQFIANCIRDGGKMSAALFKRHGLKL